MKITRTIALLSAFVLGAGCAHEQHQAQYDESITPRANSSSQYNQNDNGALVAVVRKSLQQDPQIAPLVSSIQISADRGTVILSGSVQSGEQKRQIENIVAGAAGVDVVDDQLRVSGGAMSPTSRSNSGSSIYSNGKTNEPEVNQPANPVVNGRDNSDNNVAPASNDTNSSPRIYHDSAGSMNAATNNALSPTSRTNDESHIYQQNQSQNPQVNTNGNNKIP